MRLLAATVSLLFVSQSFADCISRYDALGPYDEQPIYLLLSCRPAVNYVRENKDKFEGQSGYEGAIAQITSRDLAIEVQAANKSAVSTMYKWDNEVWHYSGSCEELPLVRPVVLTTKQHCSDTGLTLYALLSDMTIEGFTLQD